MKMLGARSVHSEELCIDIKRMPGLQTPLPQTMKQVNWAFEALLDILIIQQQHAQKLGSTGAASDESQVVKNIASQLLALGELLLLQPDC